MTAVMAVSHNLLRNRDVFVHDGATLRRLRLSVPVQMLFLAALAALVAFSGFSAARLFNGQTAATTTTLSAATEARARQIEQRQALIEAALTGRKLDTAALAAATGSIGATDALGRVETAQLQQAALVARALDVRYQVTTAELKRLGLTPARLGQTAEGGPFESVKADPTFKALFTSWKKLDTLQDGAIAVPSEKPVRTAAFTSGFGVRSDPFLARAAMHPGIDLAGPMGTPIYATADGTVLRAGWNSGGYGNLVEIDHGKGIATRYGHMSAILVSAGQHISRGQQIGRMGSTGRSTGSHLHYEVRIDGRPVNPIPFMKSTDYLLAMKAGSGASLDQVAMGGPQR
jgi:murein DD-endopeptidase MepM/ murein hydrolase activator NlpD